METEKSSITANTVVSEAFKWVGFGWTGLVIVSTVQFLVEVSDGQKITNLEYEVRIRQFAIEWAIVAVPAFVASYFGKR